MNKGESNIICNKCRKEIGEESIYCNFCGAEVKLDEEKEKEAPKDVQVVKNKNKLILGGSVIIIIGVIIIAGLISSNPVKSAFGAFNKQDYDEMIRVYKDDIQGHSAKEDKFREKLEIEVEEIENDFKFNKITFGEATTQLDEITKLGVLKSKVREIKKSISNLDKSRTAFKNAEELRKNGKYIDAIQNYSEVKEKDTENYNKSQKSIEELTDGYKAEVLEEIELHNENIEYKEILSLIKDSKIILTEDKDIAAKETLYSGLLKEQVEEGKRLKKEEAKSNQLITVEQTDILVQDTRHKALYPDMFSVIIKNNSEETIESYKVAMLGWDKNNYPLKIKQRFLDNTGSYEFLGSADNVNVIPGSTNGKNSGWKLEDPHNITKTKAIIIEAEFYDGSTWRNDYYDYFLEEFEGKKLEE